MYFPRHYWLKNKWAFGPRFLLEVRLEKTNLSVYNTKRNTDKLKLIKAQGTVISVVGPNKIKIPWLHEESPWVLYCLWHPITVAHRSILVFQQWQISIADCTDILVQCHTISTNIAGFRGVIYCREHGRGREHFFPSRQSIAWFIYDLLYRLT